MTLATAIHITDPVNEQLLFLKCRDVIGIPAEHPFRIVVAESSTRINSNIGGFRSALVVTHNNGEIVPSDCRPGVGCDDPCTWHANEPAAFVQVSLDTTYGYNADGKGCDDTHNEIVAALGDWLAALGADWWAHNEYTNEWFHREQPYKRTAHV